ncbi:MAG TPA: hypothetical protein VF681_12260 [Abditibacteriaceae bacterium]|jgi:hypothetical protein
MTQHEEHGESLSYVTNTAKNDARGGASPVAASLLAVSLVVLGFAVGYGFRTAPAPVAAPTPVADTEIEEEARPPIAKALRLSPDGRTLAFTGVYDRSRRAARFLLDTKTGKHTVSDSPRGWQDYTMAWSADGKTLLFDREKIPRSVDDATPGLHRENVQDGKAFRSVPALDKSQLPRGEKTISGFFAPDGSLVVKTRREPKALYTLGTSRAKRIDTAPNFGQNRAVKENGRTVFYVVRELPTGDDALFRLDGDTARQLTPALPDLAWTYVSEDGKWLIACRALPDETGDWDWTLFRIAAQNARKIRSQRIPSDVIGVFWSPDRKTVLGASGGSLWRIAIPSLKVDALGVRTDWNADDAAWVDGNTALVAARGSLWRVEVPSGNAREIWKFPAQYWR